MSEPEISHRCSSCGASLRGHALFCPQCGAPLAQSRETSNENKASDENKASNENRDSHPATSDKDADKGTAQGSHAQGTAQPKPVGPQRRRSDDSPAETTRRSPADQSARGVTSGPDVSPGTKSEGRDRQRGSASPVTRGHQARKNIQRATTAARDALEDNVRPRVEKIRHASSVVLEEATYDPSLRFLLIAGALFLLFIVLLVISKVI